MGCCCDQNDDAEDIQNHLLSSSSPSSSLSSASSSASASAADLSTVISPLNSHFGALTCPDTLRIILSKLPITDLARACCVCRAWNAVVSDNDLLVAAFKAPWKLRDVVGRPINHSFWRDGGISKFAVSHRISRGDTVQSLAVKFSVQMEDTYAKQEVAVLYLEGEPDKKPGSLWTRMTSDQGKRRIIDSLRRCMQVDDGTAQYYLSISNGDPRAALSQYSADLRWERQIGLT